MRVALIGLPGSGKSTLFAAVTASAVDPYVPPEPRQAVVAVPEPRLAFLVELYHPKKVIHAMIEFVDVPGCSLDDPSGRDGWRRLLPTIRQADLLVVVLREFENPAVPAFRERVDPSADFTVVWEELLFADLDTVTTRVERLEKALQKPTKSHDVEKRELELLTLCREALEAGKPVATVLKGSGERRLVSSFAFVTEKPIVVVRNVSDDQVRTDRALDFEYAEATIVLGASIEAEIAMLAAEDRAAFLVELGVDASARDRLIRSCYYAGGLISFLTMGTDEVRAWAVALGTTAAGAAGKIHTDLERGFIRAETVAYDDLVAGKDMKGARAAGRVRKEGRNYVVADGDILNILSSA